MSSHTSSQSASDSGVDGRDPSLDYSCSVDVKTDTMFTIKTLHLVIIVSFFSGRTDREMDDRSFTKSSV